MTGSIPTGAPPATTRAECWLLAMAMACAPLTTCPLLPGGSQVRPLAAIPCAFLLLLGLRHAVWTWRHQPRADLGLLGLFTVWALGVGGLAAWLGDAAPFRGATWHGLFLRASFTLAIGVGTYCGVRVACRDIQAGRWAVNGLYAGGMLACLLALAQAIHLYVPDWATHMIWGLTQALTESPWSDPAIWTGRANGPTLEPSWLASYLTVLLLPVALARVASSLRARLPWRVWRIDACMIALALLCLVAAGSRAGLAAMGLIGVGGGLLMAPRHLRLVFASGALVFVVAALLLAAQRIPYLRYTVTTLTDTIEGRNFGGDPIVRLGADERVAGWLAGCNMGLTHPLGGVGLGQAPLVYRHHVPQFMRQMPMVLPNLEDGSGMPLPNPKSMPARVLGELGVIGIALWIGFFVAVFLARQGTAGGNVLCLAGAAGIAIDWLSLDSFALPTVWFLLALCATSRLTWVVHPLPPPATGGAGPAPPASMPAASAP